MWKKIAYLIYSMAVFNNSVRGDDRGDVVRKKIIRELVMKKVLVLQFSDENEQIIFTKDLPKISDFLLKNVPEGLKTRIIIKKDLDTITLRIHDEQTEMDLSSLEQFIRIIPIDSFLHSGPPNAEKFE